MILTKRDVKMLEGMKNQTLSCVVVKDKTGSITQIQFFYIEGYMQFFFDEGRIIKDCSRLIAKIAGCEYKAGKVIVTGGGMDMIEYVLKCFVNNLTFNTKGQYQNWINTKYEIMKGE